MFNLIPVPIVFDLDRIHCYHLGGRELVFIWLTVGLWCLIKVITKLPNSEQSYKGKVKTHNYINRQNQSTTGKL